MDLVIAELPDTRRRTHGQALARSADAKPTTGTGMSGGLRGSDAELPAGGRARLPDDDVHVAPERGEEAEQPFERILAEVAPEQTRHVGLGQPEKACTLGLRDAALGGRWRQCG